MKRPDCLLAVAAAVLIGHPAAVPALESDRQQPLEVNADATDGTLGDGTATLKGNVEIAQGSLRILADIATVEKVGGRVRRVVLDGDPVHLQQEIEDTGMVRAKARKIEYEVATGIVVLTGNADVVHPQYRISGDSLKYDMNVQHFEGSGGEENGRIRIEMAPEVVPGAPAQEDATTSEDPAAAGDRSGTEQDTAADAD